MYNLPKHLSPTCAPALSEDRALFWVLQSGSAQRERRLVEASKSPTTPESELNTAFLRHGYKFTQAKAPYVYHVNKKGERIEPLEVSEKDVQDQITPKGQEGCAAIIQYREWSQEWRVRTQAEAANTTPPEIDGPRLSDMLSHRGARKIAESCEYMSLQKGGYKTFVTGTFSAEVRAKLNRPDYKKVGNRKTDEGAPFTEIRWVTETTIQREVSRAMDALQKMYQRGWVDPVTGDKVPGHDGGLPYSWVVEIPCNEHGEENPHVHMLLGWRVEYRNFEGWAQRLEKIWGNGYFHLEKIKDCTCAGAYMAKAAGYMTKGEDGQQGLVRGNRYGISESARAPDWVTVSKHQLHSMGQIIADIYDHMSVKHGPDYQERKRLNRDLESTPKEAKAARQAIGKRLQQVREKLNRLPVRASKYQLILKGQEAYARFLCWSQGVGTERPEWLPELPHALRWQPGPAPAARDGRYWRKLKTAFQQLKRHRHAITNEIGAALVEQWEDMKNAALSAWEHYQLEAIHLEN